MSGRKGRSYSRPMRRPLFTMDRSANDRPTMQIHSGGRVMTFAEMYEFWDAATPDSFKPRGVVAGHV